MNRRKMIIGLHWLVGVGAAAGASGVLIDPSGKTMGVPLEILQYSPFADFLIPGLFLFIVLGIGNIVAAVLTMKSVKYITYVNCILAGILVLWIIIQCIMLRDIVALHVIFFLIGVLQGILGLLELYSKNLFPMNIIQGMIKEKV